MVTPKKRTDADLLRESELFDVDYYLGQNPDVRKSGIDPVLHYIRSGARDGRDPSAAFSTNSYLERYPDVANAGMNPLVHYLRIGLDEGRLLNPFESDADLIAASGLFDEEYYRHFRPDLPEDHDVIRHYIRFGRQENADPSELFSTSGYLRQNPDVAKTTWNPLVHYLRHGRAEGRIAPRGALREPYFDSLYAQRWPAIAPLPVVHLPADGPRVTILTDSVAAHSLFGGVGTAIILGTLLANRLGATLRLATRTDAPDGRVIKLLEDACGVRLDGPLELVQVSLDGTQHLQVTEQEVLMTTSWWTTRAVLESTISRSQVLYLLQEDERMFYPFGDERLLCSETLAERDLTVVVNTQRLLDHLSAPDGFPHLAEDALALEPAFPGRAGNGAAPVAGSKRNFFFYSRPENARNLFWRGALVISRAIEARVLDPDEWDFHFVGRATPDLTLPRDLKPHVIEGLDWSGYQDLVHRMDAALVLMDTPHPSYPPYDLAAAGAAVLTNTHGSKQDLADISDNILVAPATVEGLLEGLERTVALARDPEARAANVRNDRINRDWGTSLEGVVSTLVDRLPHAAGRAGSPQGHVR